MESEYPLDGYTDDKFLALHFSVKTKAYFDNVLRVVVLTSSFFSSAAGKDIGAAAAASFSSPLAFSSSSLIGSCIFWSSATWATDVTACEGAAILQTIAKLNN